MAQLCRVCDATPGSGHGQGGAHDSVRAGARGVNQRGDSLRACFQHSTPEAGSFYRKE